MRNLLEVVCESQDRRANSMLDTAVLRNSNCKNFQAVFLRAEVAASEQLFWQIAAWVRTPMKAAIRRRVLLVVFGDAYPPEATR